MRAIVLAIPLLLLPLAAAAPLDGLTGVGPHFNLNLIGKEHVGAGTGGPNGHKIFVPLFGDCRIDLAEGDFSVGDADCVNDGSALFNLPNPDPDQDGVAEYRVFVRALGKPGGNATLNTCKEDEDGTFCSTETVFVARAGGFSPTTDVTRETLTVCADQDGDGDVERETIFADDNAGYYWAYHNNGLRLAQLRFYPNTPTEINQPCPPA